MADDVIPDPGLQQVTPEATQAWRTGTVLDRDDPLRPGYVRTESFKPGEAAGRAATEYEQVSRDRQKDDRNYLAAQDRDYAAYRDYQHSHPIPQPPSLAKVGPPPDAAQFQKYSMQFMGALAAVVAFSNKKSGASATDSLNAFGSAMKGWGEGNEQAYQNAAAKWKQSTEATIQNNRTALEAYDNIIKNRALNTGEMLEQMKTAAILHNDHIMYNKARQEDILGVFKLRDMQEKATNDVDAKAQPLLQNYNEQEAKNKLQAQELAPIVANDFKTPDGREYVKPDGQPLTDYDKAWAKWMVETYPPGIRGGKMTEMQQWQLQHPGAPIEQYWKDKAASRPPRNAPAMFMQKYQEEHPKADSTELRNAMAMYNSTQSRMRALGTREANVSVAINEAVRTAQLAQEASDKVPRGKWVALNQIQERIRRGTSSPEQKIFDDANAALITAYAQTMSRTGMTTVHAQERANQLLLTADGPEAYRAGVRQLIKEANTVKEAVRDAFRELTEEGGGAGAAPAQTGGGGADPLGLGTP